MGIIKAIYFLIRAFLVPRLSLAAENLALRQQVAVYKQSVKRPKLRPRDRVFWVWLSRLWSNWRSALAIVQPETVIKWHRQGLQALLAMEVEGRETRPPAHRTRNPRPDSPHVPGEPDLGRTANLSRTAPAGLRCSPNGPWPSTWSALGNRLLRPGEPSWPIMFPTSPPATSSPFRRSPSVSCTSSSCSAMTGDRSFTST